jgi:hypothetical protein
MILTFDEFTQRVIEVGPPPFRINEAHWAAEASILPYLLVLCICNRYPLDGPPVMTTEKVN